MRGSWGQGKAQETQVSHLPSSVLSFFFLFGCVGSLLLHTGFLQLWRAGATLCCGAWASHCGGFLFQCVGFSSCGSQALERRLSSCGTWAQTLCDMWDLPGPGIKPVSPALAGGFLTTVPPGKSQSLVSYMEEIGQVRTNSPLDLRLL